MSYKLYLTAENKAEWQELLPMFFEDSCEDKLESGAPFDAWSCNVRRNNWGEYYPEGSGLGAEGICTEWERVDESNERVCGWIQAYSDEGGTYILLDDNKEYVEDTSNGRIKFSNTYSHQTNITNFSPTSTSYYGTISRWSTSEITVEDVRQMPSSIVAVGGGSSPGQNNDITFGAGWHFMCDRWFVYSALPVFDSYEHAQAYIRNGSKVGLLNGADSIEQHFPREYYFEESITRYENEDFTGEKAVVERKRNYFFAEENTFRIVGYVKSSSGGYYNITFKASSTTEEGAVFFGTHVKDGGNRVPLTTSLFNLGSNEWNRGLKGTKTYEGYTYYGVPNTNIPIVATKKEAESYLAREVDEDDLKPVKLADTDLNRKHTGEDTGDQEEQVLNQGYGEPVLSTQYICTNAQMGDIADVLFTQVDSTETALKKGLERYGENPINCVIDCYHTPIDITPFVEATPGYRVRFGSYRSEAEATRITKHGNIKTLGSTQILPMFNDFRDFDGTLQLELYLPFCCTMPLDAQAFMYKTLSIKATADTRNHNIRYYIFADGDLITYKDCSFGKSVTLMGSDIASKYHQNISSEIGLNATEVGIWASAFKGDLGGVLTGYMGGYKSQEAQKKLDQEHTVASRSFAGSQSPGASESDILYPYIIFRVQKSSVPKGLLEKYGRPCNLVTTLGSVSGYTLCDNVRLETTATKTEADELNKIIMGGIII